MILQHNKSKKILKSNHHKSKKRPIRRNYHTYIKTQHGGAETYDITLYSNYTFPDTKDVATKLDDIYKNDGGKTTEMGKKLFKFINFLTNPEFETLYLKSNFTITNTTKLETTHIHTDTNTFLNFQSLILLEMCYELFYFINKDRLMIKNATTGEYFNDYNTIYKIIKEALQNSFKIEKAILLLLFPYKFFLLAIEDTSKEFKKKYSMLYHNKLPYGLILLNFLFNEFNEKNKKDIETFKTKLYNPDIENNIDINIGNNNFISFKAGQTFNIVKSKLDTLYNTYVVDINKKFNYLYDKEEAINIIAKALSLTTT